MHRGNERCDLVNSSTLKRGSNAVQRRKFVLTARKQKRMGVFNRTFLDVGLPVTTILVRQASCANICFTLRINSSNIPSLRDHPLAITRLTPPSPPPSWASCGRRRCVTAAPPAWCTASRAASGCSRRPARSSPSAADGRAPPPPPPAPRSRTDRGGNSSSPVGAALLGGGGTAGGR